MKYFLIKKHNILIAKICLLSIFFIPFFTKAVSSPHDAKGTLDLFKDILGNNILPFVISIGLILFLVGVVRFVGAGDNEEKRASGSAVMIFGIIVLFVMVGVWGLVAIFTKTFTGKSPELPNVLPELQR